MGLMGRCVQCGWRQVGSVMLPCVVLSCVVLSWSGIALCVSQPLQLTACERALIHVCKECADVIWLYRVHHVCSAIGRSR